MGTTQLKTQFFLLGGLTQPLVLFKKNYKGPSINYVVKRDGQTETVCQKLSNDNILGH